MLIADDVESNGHQPRTGIQAGSVKLLTVFECSAKGLSHHILRGGGADPAAAKLEQRGEVPIEQLSEDRRDRDSWITPASSTPVYTPQRPCGSGNPRRSGPLVIGSARPQLAESGSLGSSNSNWPDQTNFSCNTQGGKRKQQRITASARTPSEQVFSRSSLSRNCP